MSMLSIPSYKTDDPNYRYKMPKLVAKVEGRGNGIRTNIVNMGDIARALKRPADYPTKFCGHELGAQSKFDPAEGKAIVNGAHEQRHLQMLIDKFIDKFVLCQNCSLPEIDLQLKKGRVTYHCNACGDQSEVDGTHKLTTFILKNPPESADSTMGVKKRTKEERQRDKALKSQSKEGVDSGEEKKKEKKEKKDKKDSVGKEKKEKKSKKTSKTENNEEEASVLHDGEGSKKSSRKHKDKDNKNLEELDFKSSEGVPLGVSENLINFMTILDEENNQRRLNQSISPTAIADHLRLLQLTQGFGGRTKVFILLDVLFSLELGELTQTSVGRLSKYLIPISQNTSQRDILAALEDFVLLRTGTMVPEGFKKFPYFLQELYSVDVLSEEGILKHYDSKTVEAEGRASYLKAKVAAQPFLTWLQQSDDSDEDSDEGQTPTNGVPGTVASRSGTGAKSTETSVALTSKFTDTTNEDEDSDVDIDDI